MTNDQIHAASFYRHVYVSLWTGGAYEETDLSRLMKILNHVRSARERSRRRRRLPMDRRYNDTLCRRRQR